MYGVESFPLLEVGTEIASIDPYLVAAPRWPGFEIDPSALVGVVGERQSDSESTGIA